MHEGPPFTGKPPFLSEHLGRGDALPLPPLVRQLAEVKLRSLCARRAPAELQDELRLEIGFRGNSVTLFELRPPWAPNVMGPEWTRMPVAQFRYDEAARTWT